MADPINNPSRLTRAINWLTNYGNNETAQAFSSARDVIDSNNSIEKGSHFTYLDDNGKQQFGYKDENGKLIQSKQAAKGVRYPKFPTSGREFANLDEINKYISKNNNKLTPNSILKNAETGEVFRVDSKGVAQPINKAAGTKLKFTNIVKAGKNLGLANAISTVLQVGSHFGGNAWGEHLAKEYKYRENLPKFYQKLAELYQNNQQTIDNIEEAAGLAQFAAMYPTPASPFIIGGSTIASAPLYLGQGLANYINALPATKEEYERIQKANDFPMPTQVVQGSAEDAIQAKKAERATRQRQAAQQERQQQLQGLSAMPRIDSNGNVILPNDQRIRDAMSIMEQIMPGSTNGLPIRLDSNEVGNLSGRPVVPPVQSQQLQNTANGVR